MKQSNNQALQWSNIGYLQAQALKFMARVIARKIKHGYDPMNGLCFSIHASELARFKALERRGFVKQYAGYEASQQFTPTAAFCEYIETLTVQAQP